VEAYKILSGEQEPENSNLLNFSKNLCSDLQTSQITQVLSEELSDDERISQLILEVYRIWYVDEKQRS
jgi:hypothetical protein